MSKVVSLFSDTQKYEKRPIVLLADDDPSIRLMVRHVLDSEDFDIVEVADGIEAIKATEKYKPALILLDAIMPGLDGFTTCRKIKENDSANIPIMMITSLDDDVSVERAYDAGAIDYITKPIKWAVLKHRVKAVISKVIAERNVKLLAYRDLLTNLPNRLLFADRLYQAVIRAERQKSNIALILVDIDDFKTVNDTYGHDIGDLLIKKTGELISSAHRRADTIARLGGDEFAIIIENITGAQDVISIADNLIKLLEYNIIIDKQKVYTSSSIGISIYPDDGADVRVLLKRADTAMLRAKEKGRHNFQFYKPEMSINAMARIELEASLKHAFDEGEFKIYYQPILELNNNEIIGVEALLRWLHPEKGMIKPVDFISALEESRLILALGEWLIFSVCEQIRLWKKTGLKHQQVSINLSSIQFKAQNLVTVFKQALTENQLDGSSLSVEVNEATLLENIGNVVNTLNQLREFGIKVLLDDYGTGHTSLAYLKNFPLDVVKIDKTFVRGIPDQVQDLAIINAISSITQALNLGLLAEGIENKRQIDALKNMGCQYAQGFYWCKPLPADEYKNFYLDYSKADKHNE